MKKCVFVLLSIALIASCSENPLKEVEGILKEKVFADAYGSLPKYKTESLDFVDTISVADRISQIEAELKPYYIEKNLDDFTTKRNQEFKQFRMDPSYEEDVMRGKYKDASPWCTEIRQITEQADSLIKNWDSVSPYDYDYMYLNTWYINRLHNFYNTEYKYSINQLFEELPNHKASAEELKELLSKPKDEVVSYKVNYVYSFFNELVNHKVRITRTATLSPNMELIELDEGDFSLID